MQSLKSVDNLHSNDISTPDLSNEGRFPITGTAKHKCIWIKSVTHALITVRQWTITRVTTQSLCS